MKETVCENGITNMYGQLLICIPEIEGLPQVVLHKEHPRNGPLCLLHHLKQGNIGTYRYVMHDNTWNWKSSKQVSVQY